MQLILARHYKPVPNRRINKIVIHSMEAANKGDTAERVGRYFQNLPLSRPASAHVGCDMNSRVRYVADTDVAFAAPGTNHDGLHLELAGYAKYDAGQWSQVEMMAMMQQAAEQVREWSEQFNIPLIFLDAALMRANPDARGVTTHHEVSQAFRKSSHWDPGRHFPIGTLLTLAQPQSQVKPVDEKAMTAYLHCECPTGGYWLVKPSDGGVFAFDGAPFIDSLPGHGVTPVAPIVDMAAYVVDGQVAGYWLLGADGGVFAFGGAPFIDTYQAHPELHHGLRDFIGIQAIPGGYVLLSVERGSDPPRMNPYHFSR